MTNTTSVMPLLHVYDGRRCIGFILTRVKQGFEAYDADLASLGIFPTQQADAISETSHGD
jgi:hypothetical protein